MYRICRALLRLGLYGFFRRIHIQAKGRIPVEGPVLFVSNHTNAFVDPLLVLTNVRRKVTLTAKSTLVKNPLLWAVIRALDAILLHREGDKDAGADPRENVPALAEAVRRLRAGGALFVFPEGVSHSDPGMRRFRTGAARMVADYLEDATAPELMIVGSKLIPRGLPAVCLPRDRRRAKPLAPTVGMLGMSLTRGWRHA